MFLKRIKSLIFPSFLLVLFFIAIIILANTLINKPSVQNYFIKQLSHATGFDVRTGEIELNLWGGIGILVNDFDARPRDSREGFTASRVRIILDIGELMAGRIAPSSLHLFKPEIKLSLKDRFPPLSELGNAQENKIPFFWLPGLQSMLIEQGRIIFNDGPFLLEDLYLDASRTNPVPLTLTLNSNFNIGFKGKKIPFNINGIFLPPSGKETPASVDIMLRTGKVPLSWIPWPESLLVERGDFETRLRIEGNPLEKTTVNGEFLIEPLQFTLIKDQTKNFSIPKIVFDFRSMLEGKKIVIHSSYLKTQDLSLPVNLILDLRDEKKPFFELSARSESMTLDTFKALFPSPLLPEWVENRLFPLIKGGDVKLNFLTLKGNIDMLNHMGRPENRSVLEMGLECQDLEVSGGGIYTPFREVSSIINLKDDDFEMSELKAHFGKSDIEHAWLKVKNISSDSPVFEAFIDGSFDLEELLKQREMEFLPPDLRLKMVKLNGLTGRLECSAGFCYENGHELPQLMNGAFFFSDCSLQRKEFLFPLNLNKAEVLIDKIKHNHFSCTGSWGNTAFKIKGDLGTEGLIPGIKKADVSARMDINQVIPMIYQQDKLPFAFKELVDCHLSLEKGNDHWACQGDIDLENFVLESEKFSIDPQGRNDKIMFDLEIKENDRIDLKKVSCRIDDSSIELSGTYRIETGDFLELEIYSSGLSVEDLGINLKKEGKTPLEGTLEGTAEISLPLGNIADTSIKGRIEGRNLSFHLDRFPYPFKDCSFQLDFEGKHAVINLWKMKAGESLFDIDGTLKGWDGLKGDINLNSDFLDVSDIFPAQEPSIGEAAESQKNILKDMEIGIVLNISKGLWRKLTYGPLKAELAIRDGNIHINKSHVNLENGVLTLNGHVITGKEPELSFSGHIKLTDQPVDKLLEGIGMDGTDLKGNLTAEALLYMKGREKKDLIRNLTGFADVKISNGLIKNPRVFIKVLDFLSLEKLYKERPDDLKEEGLYFDRISGHAFIDNGILRSKNFLMRSPVFNAVGLGEEDLAQKRHNFKLLVQPLGKIDALLSIIPIVGRIFVDDEKTILTVGYNITGPWDDPDVELDPSENLKGIAGALKRLFLTPFRILEDINKAVKSIRKKDPSRNSK